MKKFLIFSLVLIILGGVFFFLPFFETLFQLQFFEVKNALPGLAKLAEKEIFTPPPLEKEETKDFQTSLSPKEIIKWTNIQRERNGLPALEENPKLNIMAEAKIKDMFEKQYFAHQSPLGQGVGELAQNFTYQFLAIGENLAMGNFENEESLVQAWMASPGHRENILNSRYQEIGLAAEKGIFEGKAVWLAVQHFGLPLSACPQPNEALKFEIEQKQKELKDLEGSLSELKAELQKIRPRWSAYYQERAEEYNNLVEKYNELVKESRILFNQYNAEVQEFNQCLAKPRD